MLRTLHYALRNLVFQPFLSIKVETKCDLGPRRYSPTSLLRLLLLAELHNQLELIINWKNMHGLCQTISFISELKRKLCICVFNISLFSLLFNLYIVKTTSTVRHYPSLYYMLHCSAQSISLNRDRPTPPGIARPFQHL